MIRITAQLEHEQVTDISHGLKITGAEIDQEFEDILYIYGERPRWITVEFDWSMLQ